MKYHKEYILNRKLKDISSIFKDLKSYGKYHPLIKSVELVGNGKQGFEKYIIKEQPFISIPIKIKYLAQILLHPNLIEYQISGIPLLYPRIEYQLFHEDETTTRLKFDLTIEGIPIVRNILMNKMIKSQNTLIQAINDKITT